MRTIRSVLLAGLVAAASLGFTAGSVAAYGAGDNPLAQIEYSQNCNNPAYCQSLGGVWVWIEIDGGPRSGTADVAGAGCFHLLGVGGNATSIRGEFDWVWSSSPVGFDATLGTWNDPDGDGWYVVFDPSFGFASFPATHRHYSGHPYPGVNFELQVAP